MKERKERKPYNRMVKDEFSVWVAADQKIAAFRPESGYEKKMFSRHSDFMEYLQTLSQLHYRFK